MQKSFGMGVQKEAGSGYYHASLFRYRLPGTWMRHFQARKAKNRPVFREQFCRYFQPVTEQETTAVRRKINVGGLGRQSRGQRDAGTSSEHRARMCFIITINRGMEHPLLGSTRRASSSQEVWMKSGPRKILRKSG